MNQQNRPVRILISGGGTGGHIFPALSIANALRRRLPECEILFVGAIGRMEMERVPAAGYRIEGLPVAGFDRKRLWRNFGVLVKLWKSMRKARRIVKDFAPDAAVGVGGYASGPVLKEAQRRGIPTLIQEPDAKKNLGFNPEKPLIFVTGGSLGARTVNDATAAMLQKLQEAGIQLLWQTGRLYEKECTAKAADYPQVKASAFISDMATAYRGADLVVARAGAGTISELQLLGKAALLIPSPNVAEDHQRRNAEALVEHGAAVMLLDAEAVERLGEEATRLVADKEKLSKLSGAAAAMAMTDSDEKITDTLLSLINTGK